MPESLLQHRRLLLAAAVALVLLLLAARVVLPAGTTTSAAPLPPPPAAGTGLIPPSARDLAGLESCLWSYFFFSAGSARQPAIQPLPSSCGPVRTRGSGLSGSPRNRGDCCPRSMPSGTPPKRRHRSAGRRARLRRPRLTAMTLRAPLRSAAPRAGRARPRRRLRRPPTPPTRRVERLLRPRRRRRRNVGRRARRPSRPDRILPGDGSIET